MSTAQPHGITKYKTRVTSIGPLAVEFMDEQIMVFFGVEAPEELHDHAIVHEEISGLAGTVAPGDTIIVGDTSLTVLAVGSVANQNLGSMGHLVLKFNGLSEPEMDGDVTVAAVDLPHVEPGTIVEIVG